MTSYYDVIPLYYDVILLYYDVILLYYDVISHFPLLLSSHIPPL